MIRILLSIPLYIYTVTFSHTHEQLSLWADLPQTNFVPPQAIFFNLLEQSLGLSCQ